VSRYQYTVLFAVVGALLLGGCRDREQPDSTAQQSSKAGPSDAEKERVKAFWAEHRKATKQRIDRDLVGAAESYQKALHYDPDHAEALYYRAQILNVLDRPVEALPLFTHLLEVDPHSARAHLALGDLYLCLAAPTVWNPARARYHYEAAHDINGEETGPLIRLAWHALVTDDPQRAQEMLDAVLATNPASAAALSMRAYLLHNQGKEHAAQQIIAQLQEEAEAAPAPEGFVSEGDNANQGTDQIAQCSGPDLILAQHQSERIQQIDALRAARPKTPTDP